MNPTRTDFDNPWKQILEDYFPQFLEFFFPQVHQAIDWTKPVEFLDQELQKLFPEAETSKHYVDKVAKVWLRDGEQVWILIHVEIQSQYDRQFPERMFIYHYRLFDRHKQPVVSLAILADEDPNWRPSSYSRTRLGCSIALEFPTVKLLDYKANGSQLEQSQNPFAVVVMAHLQTKATHQQPAHRLHWKLNLVKGLYERGWAREDVVKLFRFIDWLMVLPPKLTQQFKTELNRYEEEKKMQYVSSIERMAIEEGTKQGIQLGILQNARESVITVLESRFGPLPDSIAEGINSIEDVSSLHALLRRAIATVSLEAFQQALDKVADENRAEPLQNGAEPHKG